MGGVTQTIGGAVGGVSNGAADGGRAGGLMGAARGAAGGALSSTGGALGGLGGAMSGTGGFISGTGVMGSAPGALSGVITKGGLPDSGFVPNPLNVLAIPPEVFEAPPQAIADYRLARYRALVSANRATLDLDPDGQPVRKHEVVATNPDVASLTLATRVGFQVTDDELEPYLGIRIVTLAIPRKMNVRQAVQLIHRAAPAMIVDYNHIYEPSGSALLPVAGAVLASSPRHRPARKGRQAGVVQPLRGPTRIAMIDGGVASHASLARASIVQQGFAGDPQSTGHGTAVGSLLVGDQGPFHGAARGAQLFVADVYGGNPAAGSVTSIVRALSWAASKSPSVVNISLVGPGNAALARAISAVQARGIQVVAAVGNDGPAAPPQYPASYPGVVAVTGVDGQGRALPEAGRSGHLDFAAPGADMIAAFPGKGFAIVRGTSFAAPLAAARLALTGSYQRVALEARPGKGKVGRGIVCGKCRVDPKDLRGK